MCEHEVSYRYETVDRLGRTASGCRACMSERNKATAERKRGGRPPWSATRGSFAHQESRERRSEGICGVEGCGLPEAGHPTCAECMIGVGPGVHIEHRLNAIGLCRDCAEWRRDLARVTT